LFHHQGSGEASGTYTCASISYRGDGDCDDQNNTEECGYDGGDCCGDNVVTTHCTECQCLEVSVAQRQ
jgi:hypothetical protein